MQNEQVSAEKSQKSRHLSTLDFYETLQVEYIQADLRHKIYPKLKDKAFWGRVAGGKKETIEKLSERNSLPSIFTDPAMLREFQKKVYCDQGFPAFRYKNDQDEQDQGYRDLQFYYLQGAEVRVDVDGEVLIGKVAKEFIPYKDTAVTVAVKGTEAKYSIKQVTRIL